MRRPRPTCAALGLALVVLVLGTGCGDDGGGEAPADAEDPCALLDDGEVEDLLGQAVEEGEREDLEGASICTWSTEEDSRSPDVDGPVQLEVEIGELTEEIAATIREAAEDPAHEAIDLGDEAVHLCTFPSEGAACDGFDNLAVALGDRYLEVDLANWAFPADYGQDEGNQLVREVARRAVEAAS